MLVRNQQARCEFQEEEEDDDKHTSALCGRMTNIVITFLPKNKRHYENAAAALLRYLKYSRSNSSKVLATTGEEATIG